MSAHDKRAAVPSDVERALLCALARAADAGMESPHGRNAEPLRSRTLTAASIILSSLSRGETGAAHDALEALAPRLVVEAGSAIAADEELLRDVETLKARLTHARERWRSALRDGHAPARTRHIEDDAERLAEELETMAVMLKSAAPKT